MYLIIVIDPLSLGICHLTQLLRSRKPVCKPLGQNPRGFVNKGFLDLRGWVKRKIPRERDQFLNQMTYHFSQREIHCITDIIFEPLARCLF